MVPLTDPRAQYLMLKPEIDAAIQRVLESGWLILGPEVEAFEREFASYIGTDHAVGVANGTDAIALVLRGLGIGPGDEVITVSHTAVATVAAIEQAGAMPVLVDVSPGTLTLDPSQLVAALSSRTKAVMPVHLYGRAAHLDPILQFCADHGLALVEDVSQAHGAYWDGKRLGSFGHAAVFSCYPTKNLGALGDGGVIVTSDEELAGRIRRIRQYGWEERNNSLEPGLNSRLDEVQAAVLRVKLAHLDAANNRRTQLADVYRRELALESIQLPPMHAGNEHVYHIFAVQVEDRVNVQSHLSNAGIQTAVHYPIPIHLQPAYENRVRTVGPLSTTVDAAKHVLSLPMYPELSDEMQHAVVAALSRFVEVPRH